MKTFLIALLYSGFLFTLIHGQEVSSCVLPLGSSVSGADGVTLAAEPGAIEQEIAVSIVPTSDPTNVTPLPGSVTAVGLFYDIQVEEVVKTKPEGSFVVKLPVPEGVMTENLAIVLLESTEYFIEHGPDDPIEREWVFLNVTYDPATGLAQTKLGVLVDKGHIFGVVTASRFTSPALRTQ